MMQPTPPTPALLDIMLTACLPASSPACVAHLPPLSPALPALPAAMALDLASPLVPGCFMLLACLGNVSRAMVGMSAGATGAALTQHFASGRNAADISAKADSRERATSIIGSLLGMAVTQHLAGEHRKDREGSMGAQRAVVAANWCAAVRGCIMKP